MLFCLTIDRQKAAKLHRILAAEQGIVNHVTSYPRKASLAHMSFPVPQCSHAGQIGFRHVTFLDSASMHWIQKRNVAVVAGKVNRNRGTVRYSARSVRSVDCAVRVRPLVNFGTIQPF